MADSPNHDPGSSGDAPQDVDDTGDAANSSSDEGSTGSTAGSSPGNSSGSSQSGSKDPSRRSRRQTDELGFERIAEVHYCRGDDEANQYLALGPEWDLQDIVPMRVETDDGGERDEIHFIVARWENDRDRARLRARDRRISSRGK